MSTDICPGLTASPFSKQEDLLKCKRKRDKNDRSGDPSKTDAAAAANEAGGHQLHMARVRTTAVTKQADEPPTTP